MEQKSRMLVAQNISSYSINTPSSEEDIEEVPRHPVRSAAVFHSRVPVQRRLHIEKTSYAEPFHMMEISTSLVDSRRSMDGSEISSASALTMATSAGSSTTDPWSSSGFVEEWAEDRADFNWDEEDGLLLVPKLEPIEDDAVDMDMTEFEPLPAVKECIAPPESPSTTVQAKRPRGRPRKHPKPTPESLAKVSKGRSKTGCITCRKRKKKCDETKPGCLNCEKNSVKCEGYPEKTIWKSGKERAEEARQRRASSMTLSTVQLPFLINGLETEGDRIFLSHYISRLSIIFTLEGEQDSAFRNILLPMAHQDSGLMHSILALSSKHIDYSSSYGRQILADHPSVDVQALEERSLFHQQAAINKMLGSQADAQSAGTPKAPSPALYAQMLCLVLETLSNPEPTGQHRIHLEHYQRLIEENPPDEGEPMKFIHEFFQYHIQCDQLIHYPGDSGQQDAFPDDFNLPSTMVQPSAVRMLGVFDGLFLYMSKITNIRNQIRHNLDHGIEPVLDYASLHAAAEIDAGIREWTPAWPAGDARDNAGLLYRQMMWIYLWRSVFPPQITGWKPDERITSAVNAGIELLASFGPRDPSQTLILAPAFVIGCACFEEGQREPIRAAIRTVKQYMEYRNTDTALLVLEEVWRLMDARDERSWDWQAIAKGMDMDFLAT
ncbi:C6 transcription factor OefC [Drepanopeziza brunnea f. sp. 'multigermtubi' MB_m1]|uniref:C6 transcription factor OefC n=1 Tax=Marssonina brunnea f. sp. multigermtubi (strain MB_m1) TaxID=1072389 RepID=K1X291_MARBU|nr:C6 transcription factor OefC [Drepanopeziza brunnea f. sp. 'multigermtubi' MB_m1]EKD14908.1 C6 transcription factor OefC [Drepanopeziza brunnea f. sp. 'multigermtubi' MB_m1]